VEGDSLFVEIPIIKGTFRGKIYGDVDSIAGIFRQPGYSPSLTLIPATDYVPLDRPQTPKEPFPYICKDIEFENTTEKIELAGTVTTPDTSGLYPAVVLVTGSGPQDRDEGLMGHKPFLVIADYLTRNGIVVLRYDDRGTAKSKGNFQSATTMDLTSDALSAIEFLSGVKYVNKNKIGIIGHSEGGLIAPIAATQNEKIKFIITLAGTGVTGREILLEQTKLIGEADGGNPDTLKMFVTLLKLCIDAAIANPDVAAKQIDSAYNSYMSQFSLEVRKELAKNNYFMKRGFMTLAGKWMLQFLILDPVHYLELLKIPVLALWGSKDLQVPPLQNEPPVRNALTKAGVPFQTKIFESLNHLFQKAVTGGMKEYAEITETINPEVLSTILKFIKELK
jgi:dienelactone hydrolase